MRLRRVLVVVALAATTVACTSGATPPEDPAATRAGADTPPAAEPTPTDAPAGIVRLQGCEPRSLLPSDVPRRCGQQVVEGLFSALVEIDPRDGSPRWGLADDAAVAASIRSIDARRWVIEVEDGWTFHDGTPVTATSFVDAWNFAAYGPNGQANAFLFEPIVGFDDLHCPEPGCEPTDTTLDGLRVVDEATLEVVLDRPDRSFPRRLGHVAFAPLPPAAIEDPDAFREAPVGNGPFRMEGAWAHEDRIALRAVEDHPSGGAAVDGVDVLLYDDLARARADLREGRLDVATALPPDAPPLGPGFRRVVRDGDDYEALVVPTHLPGLSEDDRLGRAISMAIDRRRLIDAHLGGAARPATGLAPPVVSDEVDRCRATCHFAPEAARALLAEVGLPEGGIELWYDRDGGHEPWVRAIAGQLRRNLGLEAGEIRVRSLSHTSWVSHLEDQRVRGLYPTGWSMDVPSMLEYLEELHGIGGLFNFDRYAGADVGVRLAEARAADSEPEARLALRRLEQDLLADMHHVPLWVRTHEVVVSGRVADVDLDGKGRVRLLELELAEG